MVYKDGNGKCIAIEISNEENNFILCNVHVATEEKEEDFF